MQYSKLSTPTLCLNIASSHAYSCWVQRITMLPDKIAYQTWTPWKLPRHKAQILQPNCYCQQTPPWCLLQAPRTVPWLVPLTGHDVLHDRLHTLIHEELSPSQDLIRNTVHMMRKHRAAGNHNSEQTQCLKGSAGEKRKERMGAPGRKVMGHGGGSCLA